MTDIEITRLCAEAMGYTVPITRNLGDRLMVPEGGDYCNYNPLHNDGQAMELVKTFPEEILKRLYREAPVFKHHPETINRAIVECVAQMQKRKDMP